MAAGHGNLQAFDVTRELQASDVPLLPRGVRLKYCKVRDAWFLLAPERALKLDAIGIAILGVVDGARDFDALVSKLQEDFEAPRERILEDVRNFLTYLIGNRMVDIA